MKPVLILLILTFAVRLLQAQELQFTVFSDAKNGLAPDNGEVTVYCRLSSWKSLERRFKIIAELTDWSGQSRIEESEEFEYRMGRVVKELPILLSHYGPNQVTVSLQNATNGETVASSELSLVRLAPVPKLDEEQRFASPIGVNTHHGADWKMLARLGIHWARDYSWGWLQTGEKLPLVENGTNFRVKLDQATEAGVYILPCVRDALRHEDKGFLEPPVVQAAYRRYGDAFPEIPYWEIENEYDHQLRMKGLNSLEVWGPFIEAAHNGLGESVSKGKIVLNGNAGILYDETLELLDSRYKADFSVVNYHYYTGQMPPERAASNMNTGSDPELNRFTFLDHLRDMNQLAEDRNKEAWMTEIGWDVTYGPAVGLENQTRYLPRLYLLSLWAGTDKIFWYYDRDSRAKRIFASCGLFDLEGNMRPSAAAMAALSAQVSTANPVGRIDLGNPDIWCMLMEKPDGGYIIPVWSVSEIHDLPSSFLTGDGFDIFGNASKGESISHDVQYFHFDSVPQAWKAQAKVSLESPVLRPAYAGSEIEVSVRYPRNEPTKLSWTTLPKGFSPGAWDFREGLAISNLSVDATVPEQDYDLVLTATGDSDWSKSWEINVKLLPPLNVKPTTFQNGDWVELSLTANEGTEGNWSFSVLEGIGELNPRELTVGVDEATVVGLLADADQASPMRLRATHASGIMQDFIVPPSTVRVPRAKGKAVAFPDDASSQYGLMTEGFFRYSADGYPLQVNIHWAPEGLYYVLQLSGPIDQGAGVPHLFWEADSIEMLLNMRPGENWGWQGGTHQFYFVPVKEADGWTLQGGEWKRNDAIEASIHDDPRLQARILEEREDGYTVAVFIPAEAIGHESLDEGMELGAALSRRYFKGSLREQIDASWPVSKNGGLLDGAHRWGKLKLVQ